MDDFEYQSIEDAFKRLGEVCVNVAIECVNHLKDIFDQLEPYQKQEIIHPRKKPRGSIRRKKHELG